MEKNTKGTMKPNYPIKVLNKAFSIIDFLITNGSSVSIRELSKKLNLSPSTAHRILDTLKFWGYVEQDPEMQNYCLGLKVVEVGAAKLRQIDYLRECIPFVSELRNQTNETVHLSVLSEDEVLCLIKEESSQTIKMSSYVGKRGPLHCTASGKVLLAYTSGNKRNQMIENIGLTQFNQNTIADENELEKELIKIRSEGFALDRGEHEEEVNCIAAPIKNHTKDVIAALSVSGPATRLHTHQPDPSLVQLIILTAQRISERLGYKP